MAEFMCMGDYICFYCENTNGYVYSDQTRLVEYDASLVRCVIMRTKPLVYALLLHTKSRIRTSLSAIKEIII